MDYAKSFTFVFDDPRWVTKIAIGAAVVLVSTLLSIVLVGVLGFLILAGYAIRLLQNVRDGVEFPLPEWDDWGNDFMRGLKYVVVGLIWAIPMLIFTIPLVIGGIIADGRGAAEFMGASILFCGSCLMILYGLFLALAAPGFTIAYATDEQITSGLQFTEIWNWTQANIGQVIVAVLVILVAQLVFGLVGAILVVCLVGPALATLATSIYQHHIYGQLARTFPYGSIGRPGTLAPVEPEGLATSTETQGSVDEAPGNEETTA